MKERERERKRKRERVGKRRKRERIKQLPSSGQWGESVCEENHQLSRVDISGLREGGWRCGVVRSLRFIDHTLFPFHFSLSLPFFPLHNSVLLRLFFFVPLVSRYLQAHRKDATMVSDARRQRNQRRRLPLNTGQRSSACSSAEAVIFTRTLVGGVSMGQLPITTD